VDAKQSVVTEVKLPSTDGVSSQKIVSKSDIPANVNKDKVVESVNNKSDLIDDSVKHSAAEIKQMSSAASSMNIGAANNMLSDSDMRITNPMGSLRTSYRAMGDVHSRNANINFNMFTKALRQSFIHPNPRKLDFFSNNIFHNIFYQYNKVYGLLRAWSLINVPQANKRIVSYIFSYFKSFRIDDSALSTSIAVKDAVRIFVGVLSKLKL